mgnify:CR=1 FL=1
MNKYLSILLFCTIIFASCSQGELEQETTQEDETNFLTVAEIKGIWIDENNDNFFIYINTDGKYSFCFNQELMGSGEYTLEEDSITFHNKYLSTTDKVKVEVKNNKLTIKGNFQKFKQTEQIYIEKQFHKSNEEAPTSIIGEQWKSNKILNKNGDRREYLDVLTEYIIKYRLVRADGIETTLKEQNWFYINRKDLLYTQTNSGNGEIKLYKSPFIYESLTGISSFEIDFSE